MCDGELLGCHCISKFKESEIFCSELSLVFYKLESEEFGFMLEISQVRLQLVLEGIIELLCHLEGLSL